MNELAWMLLTSTWEFFGIVIIFSIIIYIALQLSPYIPEFIEDIVLTISGPVFAFTLSIAVIGFGTIIYMSNTYAPANWIARLPGQEATYIRYRISEQNGPITISYLGRLMGDFRQDNNDERERENRQRRLNRIENQQLNG